LPTTTTSPWQLAGNIVAVRKFGDPTQLQYGTRQAVAQRIGVQAQLGKAATPGPLSPHLPALHHKIHHRPAAVLVQRPQIWYLVVNNSAGSSSSVKSTIYFYPAVLQRGFYRCRTALKLKGVCIKRPTNLGIGLLDIRGDAF